jgi:hypothetical protein
MKREEKREERPALRGGGEPVREGSALAEHRPPVASTDRAPRFHLRFYQRAKASLVVVGSIRSPSSGALPHFAILVTAVSRLHLGGVEVERPRGPDAAPTAAARPTSP